MPLFTGRRSVCNDKIVSFALPHCTRVSFWRKNSEIRSYSLQAEKWQVWKSFLNHRESSMYRGERLPWDRFVLSTMYFQQDSDRGTVQE